jgi:hypothetical protein
LTKGQYVPETRGKLDLYGYTLKPSKPTGRNIVIKEGKLVAVKVEDMLR